MKWFKIRKPKSLEEQFLGEVLTCYPTARDVHHRTNPVRLKVEHIAGNLTHQTMFQINGSHLVSMLDAYCELNDEPLPNMKMHDEFLSTVATHVEVEKPKPSLIDRKPTPSLPEITDV
jgi:hypothetical protein